MSARVGDVVREVRRVRRRPCRVVASTPAKEAGRKFLFVEVFAQRFWERITGA